MDAWDNSQSHTTKITGYYCHHGLLSFPTWHRPYVAMLEQSIFKTMLGIVDKDFSSSPKYKDAIRKFRLPYWDPYQPRGGATTRPGPGGRRSVPYDFGAPQILTTRKVMVLVSENSTELTSVDNPLYSFKFTGAGKTSITAFNDSEGGLYSSDSTCRHPKRQGGYKESNVDELNDSLKKNQIDGVSQMIKLITLKEYKNWRSWSNHGWDTSFIYNHDSVEGFHDDYHGWLGGQYGHMSRPQIAAYDPVFWLHHCNIDRLIAVYQAINPRVWWPSDLDKLKEPASNVPLFPFRKSAGNSSWWTSEDVKTTDTFGYTYADLSIRDPNKLANDFARRYSWSQKADYKMPDDVKKNFEASELTALKSSFLQSDKQIPSSLASATSVPATPPHKTGNIVVQVA